MNREVLERVILSEDHVPLGAHAAAAYKAIRLGRMWTALEPRDIAEDRG